MPRPDLTEQRTEQILDAFERCVVKYGLDGSSLEKIGNEAGMKRTILRHYVGNREELILELANRVVEQWNEQLRLLRAAPAGNDPARALIGYLFDDMDGQSADSILVAENLIAAAERYPEVGKLMRQYVEDLTRTISERLKLVHPNSKRPRRWKIAYGIVAILFNDASLVPLGLCSKYNKAAKDCALLLVDTLD